MHTDTGVPVRQGPPQAADRSNPEGDNGSSRLKEALAVMKLAAEERHVEPICTAYQAMRAAAKGTSVGEMIATINGSLGPDGMVLIISAYSHRQCFMCSSGQAVCDQCNGTGLVDQKRACPNCDGTGFIVCGFCRGTGWADRDTIPAELRRVVLERQLSHVRAELQQLKSRFPDLSTEKIKAVADKERRRTVRWLTRLQARLSYIVESGEVKDQDERSRMEKIIAGIDSALEPIRS